jgi:hypothetical protein
MPIGLSELILAGREVYATELRANRRSPPVSERIRSNGITPREPTPTKNSFPSGEIYFPMPLPPDAS